MPSEGTGHFDLRKKNEELDERIVELRRLLMSPN
jgi:hypothetical protein